MIRNIWKYLKKRSKPVNLITQPHLISSCLVVQSSVLTIIDGLLSSVLPPPGCAAPWGSRFSELCKGQLMTASNGGFWGHNHYSGGAEALLGSLTCYGLVCACEQKSWLFRILRLQRDRPSPVWLDKPQRYEWRNISSKECSLGSGVGRWVYSLLGQSSRIWAQPIGGHGGSCPCSVSALGVILVLLDFPVLRRHYPISEQR